MASVVGGAGIFAARATLTVFLAGAFTAAFVASFRVGAFATFAGADFFTAAFFAIFRAGRFAVFTGVAFAGAAFLATAFLAVAFFVIANSACAAFFAAQRFFVASEMAFLPAAESFRLGFGGSGVAFDVVLGLTQ